MMVVHKSITFPIHLRVSLTPWLFQAVTGDRFSPRSLRGWIPLATPSQTSRDLAGPWVPMASSVRLKLVACFAGSYQFPMASSLFLPSFCWPLWMSCGIPFRQRRRISWIQYLIDDMPENPGFLENFGGETVRGSPGFITIAPGLLYKQMTTHWKSRSKCPSGWIVYHLPFVWWYVYIFIYVYTHHTLSGWQSDWSFFEVYITWNGL